eukprot:NODE_9136_length_381_cov_27.018072_g8236_i0.p1 GENE.NODE_9136_length_381_cov_27.018072_g8236_i0~~NODE_9136_length_381_cov_27.018072_g8236_i0.p1  ORF type:complete len:72 (-),score=24.02 NODE_9136_length_381_cov_27.018072_g8236_i0:165-350(-)
MIVTQPPPEPKGTNWSPEMREFLGRMLQKEQESRASAPELLQHGYLEKACSTEFIMRMLKK